MPKNNLKKRVLPSTAIRAKYKMFGYVGLTRLPHFILYEK